MRAQLWACKLWAMQAPPRVILRVRPSEKEKAPLVQQDNNVSVTHACAVIQCARMCISCAHFALWLSPSRSLSNASVHYFFFACIVLFLLEITISLCASVHVMSFADCPHQSTKRPTVPGAQMQMRMHDAEYSKKPIGRQTVCKSQGNLLSDWLS